MPSHRLASRRRATVATASAASVIVVGGLWWGAGDAAGGEAAAPPPPIGSAACDVLVDADASVRAYLADGADVEALAELRAAVAVNLCDLDGATTLDGSLDAALDGVDLIRS